MKCEKCGKNMANVHYKTNINGKITEKHLCSECAEEKDLDMFAGFDEMFRGFDEMFEAPFFGIGRGLPGFGAMRRLIPTMVLPRIEIRYDDAQSEKPEESAAIEEKDISDSDPELSKKRELNMLKAQLHDAVKDERYEDAISLRDKIKELEK